MTRIGLTAVAFIAFAGAAHAADLKAPVYKAPVMVPAYDWTGFYIGANAGIGVGENATTFTIPGPGGFTSFNSVTAAPIGAIGGVQAGYNWQFGKWVLGLETDIQGSGQSDKGNCLILCLAGVQSAAIEQKLSWFGTTRARIGYTSADGVMSYYTGGLAYGGVDTTVNEVLAGVPGTFKFGDTKTGWTLGSGVEASLGGNWTGKIEYLYVDLGRISGAYPFGGFAHNIAQDANSHIFRAGLNYRLGGSMMAPQPLANWGGFYAGANAGSGIARNENALLMGAPAPTAEQFVSASSGFIGGAQVGYNLQAVNWVFGLEADFQGSTQKDTVCAFICSGSPSAAFFAEQSLPWFGTLRGRIGYATGPTLFYLTGGLAYGKVETKATELLVTTAAYNFSDTRAGWTLGGGVERPFDFFGLIGGPNWSIKAEYLYVDLGKMTNSFIQSGVATTFTTDTTSHIFRTGINYHLNAGPAVAKY